MQGLIKTLHKRSYATRRRLLIGLCAISGLAALGLWALTLRDMAPVTPVSTAPVPADTATSLQTLGSKMQESWNSLKNNVSTTMDLFQQAASSSAVESTSTMKSTTTQTYAP